MKKRFVMAACIVAGMEIVGIGQTHAAEVTLRAVGAFHKDTAFDKPFQSFINWVNEHGKGEVQIRYQGGPESIPPLELGNAVSSGVVDVAGIPHSYYTGILPGAAALKMATNTIQDERANGCYAKIDAMHQKKMNVKFLGLTGNHVKFYLYLNKKIDKADLSGRNIRVAATYQAMFGALKGNMVNTPPGEVYTALEHGTVDGYGWPSLGIFDLGWQKHTKYRVEPGFYQVDVDVLVNLNKWKSLTDAQRKVLEGGMKVIEAENAKNIDLVNAELKRQAEAGIQEIKLQGAERERWLSTARDAGWAEIQKAAPDDVEALRPCLTAK